MKRTNKLVALLLVLVIPACMYSDVVLEFIQPKSIEILTNFGNLQNSTVNILDSIRNNLVFGTGVYENTDAPYILLAISQFGLPVFLFFTAGFIILLRKGQKFILIEETKACA